MTQNFLQETRKDKMTSMRPINLNTQNLNQTQVCSSPRFGKKSGGELSGLMFDALSNLFPPDALFQQTVLNVGNTEFRILTPTTTDKSAKTESKKSPSLSLLA